MASCLFLIDSSPAVRRLVEQASSAEGYEVTAFDDGPSALDAAKRLLPELIIADYHLDGIKFTDFCEELDRLESAPNISIISLINLADRPNEEHLRSLGVKAFLKKPIQPDHLGQTLKKLRSDPQQAGSASRATTRKTRTWPPISQATADEGGRAPDLDDLDEVETPDENLEINPVIPPAPPSKPKVAETLVQAGAREKPEAPTEDAMQGLLPILTKSIAEQVERRVSQLVPDLVAREVATHLKQIVHFEISTQLATAISLEQITTVLRGAVERELPTIAAQHISGMERTIQQNLSDTAGQSVEKVTDKLVRELVDPTVRKHLPEAVRQQLGSIDRLVKEAAQNAASQYARQAAEDIVREVAKEAIKQAVERIVPDVAETEIKKEIERLTT
ncbi:MAG: response regulator [Nitrospiraceae bacterium]